MKEKERNKHFLRNCFAWDSIPWMSKAVSHSLPTYPARRVLLSASHRWQRKLRDISLVEDNSWENWALQPKWSSGSIILIMLFFFLTSFRIPVTIRAKSILLNMHASPFTTRAPTSSSHCPRFLSVLWRNCIFSHCWDFLVLQPEMFFPTFYP